MLVIPSIHSDAPPSELYHINRRVPRGQSEPIKLGRPGHTPHPSGAGQFLTDRKSLGAGKHQFSSPANHPPKIMKRIILT